MLGVVVVVVIVVLVVDVFFLLMLFSLLMLFFWLHSFLLKDVFKKTKKKLMEFSKAGWVGPLCPGFPLKKKAPWGQ